MENSKIGKKLTDYEKKSHNPKEKCEEQLLFPKEKWNDLIVWHPVSNITTEEIYKDLPDVKQFHDNYVRFWLKDKSR